jgi:WD40 repeat protein
MDSFGGAVWCLSVNDSGRLLAAGCEDGSVRLYDLSNGNFLFKRSLARQESKPGFLHSFFVPDTETGMLTSIYHGVGVSERIVSLAWRTGKDMLAVGSIDSTIRVYNAETSMLKLFFCFLPLCFLLLHILLRLTSGGYLQTSSCIA